VKIDDKGELIIKTDKYKYDSYYYVDLVAYTIGGRQIRKPF